MSQQAFGLKKKILEVDKLYAHHPNLYEVHPEVSFKAMAGQYLRFGKKTWNGMVERLALLTEAGIGLPLGLQIDGSTAPDDVLDAAAAAWSAERIARGTALTLPEKPDAFYEGRPVAIWY